VTTTKDRFGQFAVTVGFENARPVLAIRGEVDRVNAPELGAIAHLLWATASQPSDAGRDQRREERDHCVPRPGEKQEMRGFQLRTRTPS
jgi:hypothetical protein